MKQSGVALRNPLTLALASQVSLRVSQGQFSDALLHLEMCNVGLFTSQEVLTIATRIHQSAVAARSVQAKAIVVRLRSLQQEATVA
jgi:hypothetical protein